MTVGTVHRCSRFKGNSSPVKVAKTYAMVSKAMASIIGLAESGEEKFTLTQVMNFRVTDECLPIFDINGTTRKVHKFKLVEKLNMKSVDHITVLRLFIVSGVVLIFFLSHCCPQMMHI